MANYWKGKIKVKDQAIDGVLKRQCSKCFEWKELDLFSLRNEVAPAPEIKPRRAAWCKDCCSEYGKKQYKAKKLLQPAPTDLEGEK